MNIIFAGTPEFARIHLEALCDSKHNVVAVYTQPDRPARRGQKLQASPVKQCALTHAIPVMQPITLKDADVQKAFNTFQADAMVVVAYGLMIPKVMLNMPNYGCINVHASLLPRWRGAAPIQRAIQSGDLETGVSIMQMEVGLDTGPVFHMAHCSIHADDTSQLLHDRLAELGCDALLHVLNGLEEGTAVAVPQSEQGMTYAHKIDKSEARVNWSDSAKSIDQHVRAFNPWPVAFTLFHEQPIKIWKAAQTDQAARAVPGSIVSIDRSGIRVCAQDKELLLEVIQLPGKRAMTVVDLLNGQQLPCSVGDMLL